MLTNSHSIEVWNKYVLTMNEELSPEQRQFQENLYAIRMRTFRTIIAGGLYIHGGD